MQTQETQNASNQSSFAANKGCGHSNNRGRGHYSMYLQNLILYNFGIKYINCWPSDSCGSRLMKTKAVQRMFVLKCS